MCIAEPKILASKKFFGVHTLHTLVEHVNVRLIMRILKAKEKISQSWLNQKLKKKKKKKNYH